MHEDETGSFIGGLGLTHSYDDQVAIGSVVLPPGALVPGTRFVRPSVLLTYADVVAGSQASHTTLPRVSVTVDLAIEVLRIPPTDTLRLESRILRAGQRVTVSEVTFLQAGVSHPFAIATGTFMASPREVDAFPVASIGGHSPSWILERPLAEHVGLSVLEPGVSEVHRRPDLGNASDSLQGGLVGLLAEAAAESLVTARAGRPWWVRRLDVRYLAAIRVGPGVASARVLRLDEATATVRVEVRDRGRGSRLTGLVGVECVPLEIGAPDARSSL